MPENTRCNFEHGWCGWRNVPGRPLNWTLNRGATPSERTGPSYDHTYRNASGVYIVTYALVFTCISMNSAFSFVLNTFIWIYRYRLSEIVKITTGKFYHVTLFLKGIYIYGSFNIILNFIAREISGHFYLKIDFLY